jgi:hypothetical protein
MTQGWWMHFPLCPWGCRQGFAPATALHITGTWRGNPPFVIVAVAMAVTIVITVALTTAISVAVAVNINIAYCGCPCCWPVLLQLPSPITTTISFPLSLAITIADPLAIGHCRLRHR